MSATAIPSVILSLSSNRKGYRDYFESESIVSKSNRTWGDEDRRLRVALAGKDYFSCSSEDCRHAGLAMAGRLCEHRAAPWAELGFLARQATGHAFLVGNLIGAESVSIILTRQFLPRPQSGLAESGVRHVQRDES